MPSKEPLLSSMFKKLTGPSKEPEYSTDYRRRPRYNARLEEYLKRHPSHPSLARSGHDDRHRHREHRSTRDRDHHRAKTEYGHREHRSTRDRDRDNARTEYGHRRHQYGDEPSRRHGYGYGEPSSSSSSHRDYTSSSSKRRMDGPRGAEWRTYHDHKVKGGDGNYYF